MPSRIQIVLDFVSFYSAEYALVGGLFGFGKSTVCTILLEFCNSAWEILAPRYMNFFPLSRKYVVENINLLGQMAFPQCFDGCHIEVRPSKNEAVDYYNYKGWYSVVLLALVDAKYRFMYVNVGNAGRCNDSSILESSALKQELLKCSLLSSLGMRYNNTDIPVCILGDSAFRLTKHVMKPYPYHTTNSPQEKEFNYRLSKCRRLFENLKNRIGKGIDNRTGNAKAIISTANK